MSTQLGLFFGPYSNPDASDTDDTGVGSRLMWRKRLKNLVDTRFLEQKLARNKPE